MLSIKFRRIGKKKQASFRIVVAEARSKVAGRYVEDIGWFDPHSGKVSVEKARVAHWMKCGAQPTASVHNLFVREGALKEAKKKPVHNLAKKKTDKKK